MTIAFGHGLAVAPLQFAAAACALVNGGTRVVPTFIKQPADAAQAQVALIRPATSDRVRELMRLNVTDAAGTGKRADVPGYSVGGKTGTAEIPGPGGYREKAVISSFLAAFPMQRPKYLVFVLLFEPHPRSRRRRGAGGAQRGADNRPHYRAHRPVAGDVAHDRSASTQE